MGNEILIPKDRSNISSIAEHIMGRTSSLRAMRTTNVLSVQKVRELCAEIYCYVDDILEVVERAEKRGKK